MRGNCPATGFLQKGKKEGHGHGERAVAGVIGWQAPFFRDGAAGEVYCAMKENALRTGK